jgi:5'-nucleotidase
MDELLSQYQQEVDGKYNAVICRLPHDMEHADRFRETELGNLFSDILHEQLGVDVAFVASGSIRKPKLTRLVTRSDLMEVYPYDEAMISFSVNGTTLEQMLRYLMQTLYQGESREFYQWNAALRVQVSEDGEITNIEMRGAPLEPETQYRIAMQDYHFGIIADTFGITHEELADKGRIRTVSTSAQDNVIEYFRKNKIPRYRRDGRIAMAAQISER